MRCLLRTHVLRFPGYILLVMKGLHRVGAGALASQGPQLPSLPGGLAVPPLARVLQWAAVTLDVHFPALARLPGALPLVQQLQAAVAEDLRVCRKVALLGGVMQHMQRQAPLPTFSAAAAQPYSVELLDLRVRHTL